MFEKNLTVEQQGVFLGLLNQLILADGLISDAEQEKWNAFAAVFPHIKPKFCPHDQLVNAFPSQTAKASVMLELISVAEAKGDIVAEDKEFLQSIAKFLNIPNDTFEKMRLWVSQVLDLIKQSQKFMED